MATMQAAHFLTVAGTTAVILAIVAWVQDRRRVKRKNLDRVGFMPWTGIFFSALLAAVVLVALAAKQWLAG